MNGNCLDVIENYDEIFDACITDVDNTTVFERAAPLIYKTLKDPSFLVSFVLPSDFATISESLKFHGFKIQSWPMVCMRESSISLTRSWECKDDLYFLVLAVKGSPSLTANHSSLFSCKDIKPVYHPQEKPVELIKRIIELITFRDALILDPFAGSNTTAIACMQTHRRYLCIEVSRKYYQRGQDRLNEYNNKNDKS